MKLHTGLCPPRKPRIFQNRDAYIMRREAGPEKGPQQLGRAVCASGHRALRSSPPGPARPHMAPLRSVGFGEARPSSRPGRAGEGGARRWLAIWPHRRLSGPAPPHRPTLYFSFLSVPGGRWGAPGQSQGSLSPRLDFGVSSGHPAVCRVCTWPQGPGELGCGAV